MKGEVVVRLSSLLHEHINMLGRYPFSVPEAIAKGDFRPLRDPSDGDKDKRQTASSVSLHPQNPFLTRAGAVASGRMPGARRCRL